MSSERECEKTRKRIIESQAYQDNLKRDKLGLELREWMIDCIPHGGYHFSVKKGWFTKLTYLVNRYRFMEESMVCFNTNSLRDIDKEKLENIEFLLQNKDKILEGLKLDD